MLKLISLPWCYQISGGFVSYDFLELTPKFWTLLKAIWETQIIFYFNSPYHKHFWLSINFYRTQISSIDLEKHYFLWHLVTKMWHKLHWVTLSFVPVSSGVVFKYTVQILPFTAPIFLIRNQYLKSRNSLLRILYQMSKKKRKCLMIHKK